MDKLAVAETFLITIVGVLLIFECLWGYIPPFKVIQDKVKIWILDSTTVDAGLQVLDYIPDANH